MNKRQWAIVGAYAAGLAFLLAATVFGNDAGYRRVVRCKDCARSRVERHTGDDALVCWKRKSHGEAVPDDGFCHDGVRGKGGGR